MNSAKAKKPNSDTVGENKISFKKCYLACLQKQHFCNNRHLLGIDFSNSCY